MGRSGFGQHVPFAGGCSRPNLSVVGHPSIGDGHKGDEATGIQAFFRDTLGGRGIGYHAEVNPSIVTVGANGSEIRHGEFPLDAQGMGVLGTNPYGSGLGCGHRQFRRSGSHDGHWPIAAEQDFGDLVFCRSQVRGRCFGWDSGQSMRRIGDGPAIVGQENGRNPLGHWFWYGLWQWHWSWGWDRGGGWHWCRRGR